MQAHLQEIQQRTEKMEMAKQERARPAVGGESGRRKEAEKKMSIKEGKTPGAPATYGLASLRVYQSMTTLHSCSRFG